LSARSAASIGMCVSVLEKWSLGGRRVRAPRRRAAGNTRLCLLWSWLAGSVSPQKCRLPLVDRRPATAGTAAGEYAVCTLACVLRPSVSNGLPRSAGWLAPLHGRCVPASERYALVWSGLVWSDDGRNQVAWSLRTTIGGMFSAKQLLPDHPPPEAEAAASTTPGSAAEQ
jgi:hypothetical protein